MGMSIINSVTLIGGFACPEINEVLSKARYLINDRPEESIKASKRRLLETSAFIHNLSRLDLKPFKAGWYEVMRIRFYHCRVRKKLLSEDWNLEKYGIPINQLHLIATLLGFQINPILLFKKLYSCEWEDQEKEDFTAVWRYVGYLLGIDEKYNPCKSYNLSVNKFRVLLFCCIATR
eukprot:UN34805